MPTSACMNLNENIKSSCKSHSFILEWLYGDDIGSKGGGTIDTTTLFGKYQICRELGRGQSGTVYLAKHMDLEEYRAIKQVPKSCADYEQFRKEALILKCIRHPGIPIVYDLEDTADYSYMILEFLEGDSLYALVSGNGHFSTAMTIRYGIQICHLVNILHSARPNPILYLDLQPKNLLVSHDVVKLIDFDHSVHVDEAEKLTKRYGTVGCAAPEQYTGDVLDERTDIYAIGAVLSYMLTGTYPERSNGAAAERSWNGSCAVGNRLRLVPGSGQRIDRDIARVIHTCLQQDKSKRYQTVEELEKALLQVEEQRNRGKRSVWGNSQISSLTIAVAGSSSGVGTTHIAMGMTAHLRRRGLSAMYEEKNGSGAVRQFATCVGAEKDSFGIVLVHGIPMLPLYGSAVKLKPHPYPVVVRDYGCDRKTWLSEPADGYLLVCGGKPWEWETTRDAVSDPGIHPGQAVIYNQFCRQVYAKLPGPARGTDCFLMPHCSNPLESTKAVEQVYEEIVRSAIRN